MYNVAPLTGAGAAVLGAELARNATTNPVASRMLAATGISCGLYICVAVSLMLIGMVLSFLARRNQAA